MYTSFDQRIRQAPTLQRKASTLNFVVSYAQHFVATLTMSAWLESGGQ